MRYNKAVKWSLIAAGFSGAAVFLNSLTVKSVGDALVFTTIKNLGAAGIIGMVLAVRSKRQSINWQQINRKDWVKLGMIGVFGGALAFYLFFKGLMIAQSAQAALIHKSLVLWLALAAGWLLKEKLSLKQWLAVMIVFGSNFLIGGLGRWQWGKGETMILLATMLWAGENVLSKILLEKLPETVVAAARMIFGSIILFLATFISGKISLILKLSGVEWGMTILSMGLLAGFNLSFYKAVKLGPVTLAAAVLSLGSVLTNILSSIFITHNLTINLINQSVLLLIFLGIFIKEVKENARIVKVRQVCIQPE